MGGGADEASLSSQNHGGERESSGVRKTSASTLCQTHPIITSPRPAHNAPDTACPIIARQAPGSPPSQIPLEIPEAPRPVTVTLSRLLPAELLSLSGACHRFGPTDLWDPHTARCQSQLGGLSMSFFGSLCVDVCGGCVCRVMTRMQ